MNIFFGIVFVIFFYIISYPFAKNLQLCGYNEKYIFVHLFKLPYEFKGKNSLVWTKRMVRLAIAYLLVLLATTLTYFILLNSFWWILLVVVVQFLILPYILLLTSLIMQPIEIIIKKIYIKKACKILDNFKGIKIAITGSFGKTSTKNFLASLLRCGYKVCVTPKNYNTPMGVCRTVIENLKPTDEVLIVEMGARRSGDIAQLTKMVKPQYGILTAIGEQHLETFGSVENILKTKFELCEHMSSHGKVLFDGASEFTSKLYSRFVGEKYLINDESGVCFVKDAKYSISGASFKLYFNQNVFKAKTKILGAEMLNDIALAAYMAFLLGISEKDIVKKIASLTPTPHRLQLIQKENCSIIDDSYNSNLIGAKQACECLKLFKGKKIVVSPGFVEQGAKQYELNFKLGKMIGQSCDAFVVMNQTNKTALVKGAIAGGLSKKQIYTAASRPQQLQILKQLQEKGSVVLFENDLPDNFR